MISVIIPSRKWENQEITLKSLEKQTFRDFEVIVSIEKHEKGACWARNKGFRKSKGDFILFSDNDIEWEPTALEVLYLCLKFNTEKAYSYGSYLEDGVLIGNQEWDSFLLTKTNYINTMSLIRRECFPGFDEKIKRLQDWDLWLTMLAKGHTGIFCNQKIFSTKVRNGITYNSIPFQEAYLILKNKHNL